MGGVKVSAQRGRSEWMRETFVERRAFAWFLSIAVFACALGGPAQVCGQKSAPADPERGLHYDLAIVGFEVMCGL